MILGPRIPQSLLYLKEKSFTIYDELVSIRNKLERRFKDMQLIEFTVESNKLYILETQVGRRTSKASVHMAVDMVNEGLITEREALLRINPAQLDFYLQDMIDPEAPKPPVVTTGRGASPGSFT